MSQKLFKSTQSEGFLRGEKITRIISAPLGLTRDQILTSYDDMVKAFGREGTRSESTFL